MELLLPLDLIDFNVFWWWMFVFLWRLVTHFFPLASVYYPRLPTDNTNFTLFSGFVFLFPQNCGKIPLATDIKTPRSFYLRGVFGNDIARFRGQLLAYLYKKPSGEQDTIYNNHKFMRIGTIFIH